MITNRAAQIAYHNNKLARARKLEHVFTLDIGSPICETVMPFVYSLNAIYHDTMVTLLGGKPTRYDGYGSLPEGVTI